MNGDKSKGQNRARKGSGVYMVACSVVQVGPDGQRRECGKPVQIRKKDTVVINGERRSIAVRAACAACWVKMHEQKAKQQNQGANHG